MIVEFGDELPEHTLSANTRLITAGILALVLVHNVVHGVGVAWTLPADFLTGPLLAAESVLCLTMLALKLGAKMRTGKLEEIREAGALAGAVRGGMGW